MIQNFRLKNFKVQKPQLQTLSRLRPSQWKELESEFAKCAESLGIFAEGKVPKPKKANELLGYLDEVKGKGRHF